MYSEVDMNFTGLSAASTRPIASCEGMPFSKGTNDGAWNPYGQGIWMNIHEWASRIRDAFNAAQQWQQQLRRDPLTLDLDGDGLETTGLSSTNPILFDRNGNGTIDSGRELFGDSTELYSGGQAADGFAALAQEDSNGDGVVDSADANWQHLRVWRDLNQDGISQAGELFTLDALGIAGLNVAKTEHSQVLANGNQIADLGTYIRSDGSVGQVGQMADIDLVEDSFHREFTDEVPLAEGVAALPEMGGSGLVRDLREAASLSPELKDLLAQYSQAGTREAQRALLDQMLDAWADTSGLKEHIQERASWEYTVAYQAFGSDTRMVDGPFGQVQNPDWAEIQAAWEQKLHVLEAFNGRYFFRLPNETESSGGAVFGLGTEPADESGVAKININLSQDQVNLLNQSYAALKESVYASLLLQTRFKPLMDQVELVIEKTGGKLEAANDSVFEIRATGL
jgi:hypothetical protein